MPSGLGVMVVEDEPLLTMMLEELLDELGCRTVATVDTVHAALDEIGRKEFDIAILDVHLRGESVWPVADRLLKSGRPFIIASGDEGSAIKSRYPGATVLPKPYELDTLARALQSAMHANG